MNKIFNVRITSGTSPGPYNVYYDIIDPLNIALLTGSETPATGLTLSQLVEGVGVLIPEQSTSVILYNVDCEINITYVIPDEELLECLDGLIVESIYLHNSNDLNLIPNEYVHPCSNKIGTHVCNRSLFEIYANNIFVGYGKLNNAGGSTTTGVTTNDGVYILGDYVNRPNDLVEGTWSGSSQSRYSKIEIDSTTAIQIAQNSTSSNTITFSIIPSIITYNVQNVTPHSDINWVRISNTNGDVFFNGCIGFGDIQSIDICTPIEPTPEPTPSPTPSPTPEPIPEPTPSPTPELFIIYRSGFAALCEEFCQNKINFTIQTTASSSWFDIGVGDTINGIISSGYYAIGSDPGNTDEEPFKVVLTDSNGEVLGVSVCSGNNCVEQ